LQSGQVFTYQITAQASGSIVYTCSVTVFDPSTGHSTVISGHFPMTFNGTLPVSASGLIRLSFYGTSGSYLPSDTSYRYIRVLPRVPPQKPTNLAANSGSASTINLRWTRNTADVTGDT